MLVLSRKKGESIMIGSDIEVVVLGVDGDNIKLGIRAPRQVDVYRKEVFEAIQEANKEASSSVVSSEELKGLLKK